jgi:hypothetical protein
MTIEIGDTVPFSLTTRNAAKVATDVVSAVLVITKPDGTTSSPTVGHVAASGLYTASFVPTLAGPHPYTWTATDPVNGGTFTDSILVEDGYVPFVSLDEQLRFMRATSVITDPDDVETLRGFIRVACEAVELDLGRYISPQTVTRTFDGGVTALVLKGPIMSITTVSDGGSTLTTDQYVADTSAGIVYRGGSNSPRWFTTGRQTVAITYRAGTTRPSPVARKVAMNGAMRMWQGSQQMPHPELDDLDAETQVRAGVLTPLEYAAYLKLKGPGLA